MEGDPIEDVFLQDSLCPSIAEHATQCNSLFRRYMAVPDIVLDPTIMDDQLARFTLWTTNMDVYGPLNVSLDYRLRFSPTIVEIIHQLLDVVCDTLTSLKPTGPPPQTPSRKRQRVSEHADSEPMRRDDDDDVSDSESDVDQAEENVSKITDTIGGTVTRLFRLSNAVRKSAKANRARKIEKYRDDQEANKAIAELRLYTECYIRFRYPMAPDLLRSALVEANALRLRRLYYERSHRRRINLSIQNPPITSPLVRLPKRDESASAVHFAPSVPPKLGTMDKKSDFAGHSPAPLTNATTARQTAAGALYAKSTTEVPRAKSVLVNNKLSFPPIPSRNECPYCGLIIEFRGATKSVLWQNHIIGDLEPFICVFGECLEACQHGTVPLTFETSKTWISHMQNAHGHAWECRAPSHNPIIFDQEIQFQQHSINEHGVPEAYAETLSSAARRPLLDKMQQCPFGDDFQHHEKVESSAVFSSEALQAHVAAHIKEIALLALQKLPNDVDEIADNVDSDKPLEDDGPGIAKWRGSMYSVLDDETLDFQDEGEDAEYTYTGQPDEDISPSITRLELEDKEDSGMAVLHQALQSGDLPLARSLISRGANLSSRDRDGRTALHYAFMGSHRAHDMLLLCLTACTKEIINSGDNYGQTVLHYAAERGSTEGVDTLIRHGANIHATDMYGFSACMWAVVAGQTGTTRGLIELGADINLTCLDGKSALDWALGLRDPTIAEVLINCGAYIDMSRTRNLLMMPLGEAVLSSNPATVLMLLSYGVDINDRDRDGWSGVHWAAEQGYWSIVKLLLDNGARVDTVSSYGTSPLHCAANGGHADIVRDLLRAGADPLKATCHGWTALHHAAFMGHSQVVRCLLEDERVRTSASLQDNHGWSVLHLAIHSRTLDTVHALLNGSVNPELSALVDESGLTAADWLELGPTHRYYKAVSELGFSKSRCCSAVTGLRQATLSGNVPLIELLLRSGQAIDGVDSGNRTALYYAAKRGMLSIMDLLLDKGASPYVLPTGHKVWEEFISDDNVLLRLYQRGYEPVNDPEIERKIKLALCGQKAAPQPARTEVDLSKLRPSRGAPQNDSSLAYRLATGEGWEVRPTSQRLFSSGPKITKKSSRDQDTPSSSPLPKSKHSDEHQADSGRGGGTSLWNRLFR